MNEEFNLPAVLTEVLYGHENDEPPDRKVSPRR